MLQHGQQLWQADNLSLHEMVANPQHWLAL
jgi:hypothetical protein